MATSADIQTYNSDLDAFELYHKEKERHLFAEPELPAIGHGLAGSVGAAVSNAAIYPLNLLITRAQTKQRSSGSADDGSATASKKKVENPVKMAAIMARQIYADEGLAGLYAGLGIDTVKHSVDSFLFFMAYNTLRQSRLSNKHGGSRKHLPVIDELGIGFLAGAFSKFFTSPLSNIVTRLQTTSRGRGQKTSVRDVARKIRDEKGLAGFWTGYSAQLILTLNPSLTFFFHEFLNRIALPKSQRDHPPFFATFFLAALSKSFASCVTYPFTLAKARAQTTSSSKPAEGKQGASEKDKSSPNTPAPAPRRTTIFGVIARIATQEGISALYEGLELEVLKGFLSHGLTMVIKDFAHAFILKLYWAILKLRKAYPDREAEVRAGLGRTLEAAQTMRQHQNHSSARDLGSSLFDDGVSEVGQAPLQTEDDLVPHSAREWVRSVADDVFETSKLKMHKNADAYKALLVDFIEEHAKVKPRTLWGDED